MKKLYVVKKKRPLGWETWEDSHKIQWLEKKKNKTPAEEKELRALTQKKKFKGFAQWLEKRREAEKGTATYQKKLERRCREKREVKSCKECLRYSECFEGKKPYGEELTRGELRLGHTIILSIEQDIMRCYQRGWKDQLNYWLKVLADERTGKLTAETVDGYASAEAILAKCRKRFGEFEPIYQRCQKTYKPRLEELEKQLEKLPFGTRRAEKIADEINMIVKKLYGDTLL